MTAQRIELSSDGLNLQVDVDNDGRIAVAAITGGGTSLRQPPCTRILELQYVDAPHRPVQRLGGSAGASRLRYREHLTGVEGDTHWLVVTAEDPNRVSARWLPATGPDRRR